MTELTNNPICGIYGLLCKPTGKWYVGQSKNIWNRIRSAYELGNCKGQAKIHSAIKKYGFDEFDVYVLEESSPVDWILDYREMLWIAKLDSVQNGYNLLSGGRSGKHSEESKRKISLARMGMKFSDETRRKLSIAKIGKVRKYKKRIRVADPVSGRRRPPFTEQHKYRLSVAKIGKKRPPMTVEHKKKIGQAAKLRYLRNKSLDEPLITN